MTSEWLECIIIPRFQSFSWQLLLSYLREHVSKYFHSKALNDFHSRALLADKHNHQEQDGRCHISGGQFILSKKSDLENGEGCEGHLLLKRANDC